MFIRKPYKMRMMIRIMDIHVVLGASGGWGSAITHELVKQGKKVRGINRSGRAAVPLEVEMVAADITDKDRLAELIEDAAQVYHCVNLPYNKWTSDLIPLTRTVISAAEQTGVPILVADNLYMYPEDAMKPLHEEMPWTSTGRKGKVRAESSKMFLDAHNDGRINVVIVRAPDFYGPTVGENSFYGSRVFIPALRGKRSQVFGSLDHPHQIAYTPDLARASIMVAEDREAYGQVWHLPSAPAVTQREFLTKVYRIAGTAPKFSTLGRTPLRIIGIFNKIIGEVVEMLYEFEKPYLVSHEKFMQSYDFRITPLEEGIEETLNWYRSRIF